MQHFDLQRSIAIARQHRLQQTDRRSLNLNRIGTRRDKKRKR
jgi:hypothetical protein